MSVSVQRLVVLAAALVLAVFAYNTLAGPANPGGRGHLAQARHAELPALRR